MPTSSDHMELANQAIFFSFKEDFQSCEPRFINNDPYSIFRENLWTNSCTDEAPKNLWGYSNISWKLHTVTPGWEESTFFPALGNTYFKT